MTTAHPATGRRLGVSYRLGTGTGTEAGPGPGAGFGLLEPAPSYEENAGGGARETPAAAPVDVPVDVPVGVPAQGAAAMPREPFRPYADCVADRAGGLTFDIRLPAPGAAAGDVAGDAALLLKLRGGGAAIAAAGTAAGRESVVRLPLTPVGRGPTDLLRAALPSTMTLAEGRWDAYLALSGCTPRRLLPGVHDLRSLVDRVPRGGRTWLGVRIPYATKKGNLTVRSWLRWPHAEAGKLCVGDAGMTLRGILYGAELAEGAGLEAHAREGDGAPVAAPVTVPVAQYGPGQGAHEGHSGGRFTVTLPYAALPAPGPRVWDLWLRPHAAGELVRVARILDDVPDKKRIYVYPPHHVGDASGERTVRPYYTLANGLALRLS